MSPPARGFAGPSNHRCKSFGEDDGRDGSYRPCPPDLCEADILLERIEASEARADTLAEALREMLKQAEIQRYPAASMSAIWVADIARTALAGRATEEGS